MIQKSIDKSSKYSKIDSIFGTSKLSSQIWYLKILNRQWDSAMKLDEKIDEKDFYYQVTKRICSTLDLNKALWQTLHYLKDIMPADLMTIGLFESEMGGVRSIATATVDKDYSGDRFYPLSMEARKSLEEDSLAQVRIINPMLDPITRSKPYRKWITRFFDINNLSEMVMFLKVQDVHLGNLVLFAKGKNRYTDEHLQLFSMLNDSFAIALSNTMRYQEIAKLKDMLIKENESLSRELYRLTDSEIIGRNSGLKAVMNMVQEVAFSDSPVLLSGETGVGKDIIAKAIHFTSPRHHGPFIKVNCGAIPESLLESELFGHEKGAFTGAIEQKRGCFERADEGTIFLDEIGEMPIHAQVRLLRVLQDKEIDRVGGSKPIKLDIRVIAATNRDLEKMIRENLFRLDLWYRLQVFPMLIPPLRNRREDIPAMVSHFIESKARELKIFQKPVLARGAIDRLVAYAWPGNVRELENLIERALVLSKGRPMTFNELGPNRNSDSMSAPVLPFGESYNLDDVVSNHIKSVLALTKGRVGGSEGAAEILGIHANTLRNRMNKLGIPYGRRQTGPV